MGRHLPRGVRWSTGKGSDVVGALGFPRGYVACLVGVSVALLCGAARCAVIGSAPQWAWSTLIGWDPFFLPSFLSRHLLPFAARPLCYVRYVTDWDITCGADPGFRPGCRTFQTLSITHTPPPFLPPSCSLPFSLCFGTIIFLLRVVCRLLFAFGSAAVIPPVNPPPAVLAHMGSASLGGDWINEF